MMSINLFAALCISAIILSTLALLASLACIAFVVGLRNSTHNIQWVPLSGKKKESDSEDDSSNKEENEEEGLVEEYDNF